MNTKKTMTLIVSTTTALSLTACTGSTTTAPDAPASTITVATEPTQEATTVTESVSDDADDGASHSHALPQAGEDPVFAALDTVIAQYGGVIVDVDREDSTTRYDVDVVVDNQVIEVEVDAATSSVTEDEREGDDDDVAKAHAASVTAADAARQALQQFPDGVIDEMELSEDDGRLTWEIELDDQNRNDLAELNIPAA